MEVTEFRSLKDLAAEFRLTQLLWDSLEEWDALRARWQQVRRTPDVRLITRARKCTDAWVLSSTVSFNVHPFPDHTQTAGPGPDQLTGQQIQRLRLSAGDGPAPQQFGARSEGQSGSHEAEGEWDKVLLCLVEKCDLKDVLSFSCL